MPLRVRPLVGDLRSAATGKGHRPNLRLRPANANHAEPSAHKKRSCSGLKTGTIPSRHGPAEPWKGAGGCFTISRFFSAEVGPEIEPTAGNFQRDTAGQENRCI